IDSVLTYSQSLQNQYYVLSAQSVCRYCLNLQYISLCYLQLLYSLRNIYYFATLYSFFLYFHIIHYINIKKHQLNELSMVLFKIIFLIEIACLKKESKKLLFFFFFFVVFFIFTNNFRLFSFCFAFHSFDFFFSRFFSWRNYCYYRLFRVIFNCEIT